MMRGRWLKPEFWGHRVMSKQRDSVQLLAIALLNFSDDDGYFWVDFSAIRGQCRPNSRPFRLRADFELLVKIRYVETAETPEGLAGRLPTFLDHQKIDRPRHGKVMRHWPQNSTIDRRSLDDASIREGKGREGIREGIRDQGKETPSATSEELKSVMPTLFDDGAVKRSLGAHRDNPGVHGWFEFQKRRRAQGFDVVERPPKPEKFDDLWSLWLEMREKSPHLESGGEDAGIWVLVDLFFADAFWKAKSCPWNGFASQWSDYAAKYKAAHR